MSSRTDKLSDQRTRGKDLGAVMLDEASSGLNHLLDTFGGVYRFHERSVGVYVVHWVLYVYTVALKQFQAECFLPHQQICPSRLSASETSLLGPTTNCQVSEDSRLACETILACSAIHPPSQRNRSTTSPKLWVR
jgi:hypothetical protein